MKNSFAIAGALLLVCLVGVALAQVPGKVIISENLWADVTYFTSSISTYIPTPAPGQRAVELSTTTAPVQSHYDHVNSTWREGATRDEAQTLSGAQTITGTITSSNTNTWSGTNTFSGTVSQTADVTLGDNEDDDVTIDGQLIRKVYRQDFDCTPIVRAEADFTTEDVADTDQNIAIVPCGDPELQNFHFRLEQAQASPFVVGQTALVGHLDIDNDAANNEGVAIVVGTDPQQTYTPYNFGEAWYMRVGFTITSVSGLSEFFVGWRVAEDYIDANVLATSTDYGGFHWDDNAGNCMIACSDDGTEATDELTGCDLSDGESIVVEVAFTATGTYTYTYAATELLLESATPLTDAGNCDAECFATGEVIYPYIMSISGADNDHEIRIDFIEVGQVQ